MEGLGGEVARGRMVVEAVEERREGELREEEVDLILEGMAERAALARGERTYWGEERGEVEGGRSVLRDTPWRGWEEEVGERASTVERVVVVAPPTEVGERGGVEGEGLRLDWARSCWNVGSSGRRCDIVGGEEERGVREVIEVREEGEEGEDGKKGAKMIWWFWRF